MWAKVGDTGCVVGGAVNGYDWVVRADLRHSTIAVFADEIEVLDAD